MRDKTVEKLIKAEVRRQNETINLIASENYVSRDVLSALGSVFTNKYAEGYSRHRYYGGNKFVDELEDLAKTRALKLFHLSPKQWSVNVQAYSGSPANLAAYLALVPPGEKIMGMRLDMGGHLTHGHRVSFTGKLWHQVPYGVNKKTEKLDYGEISALAKKEKPFLIVTGYTAYSRRIDFKKFRAIAEACGAILMVDLSHIAGLVAGKAYPSPFPHADIVTMTTHKTLRGPRSALIFSRKQYSAAIDKAIFPGLQGGPHANQIGAVAVALFEAAKPQFPKYARQIVKNTKILASGLQKLGWRIVSGGTDSHLFLVDTWGRGIGGKEAGDKLESLGIIVNKNAIPYDTRSPVDPSGIRLGTAALTTRGMKEREMLRIAGLINAALLKNASAAFIQKEVVRLCRKFPIRV
ncbi:MAG: Serine hydroxymethyltransferase [Candidatus Jorgensenbacteria bacterium GW2011_GWA1_48_11]|uniref:Serine hydroxymethyltransferase n=1 Tax=Candidatus Jorgensenbacteria bacterium GW2011_GWA1_48_11 TaxID=1618660 RepID=A0A0G1UBX0_9BACT|nr:MAG: Serine hydroxymethyltransferase [Candidatus Jorgensenbacteria bacterium GW2011_GWA1_48_11]KKW12109.1 MAG: Serine hydroxymethyltransferase [Candidatus Jorgensenbacteria bacterium GW2011_GWB1_49_9]